MEIQHTDFSYHFKTSKEKNGTYLSSKTQVDRHQNLIFASMGTGTDTWPYLVGTTIVFYIPSRRDYR